MAISARAVGAWAASNATTQTVTLPTHQAGDMLIVRTIRKPFTNPNDTVINTAGWNPVATGVANGSTANGVGVGSMGFKAFWKVATSAAEPNPVVTWGTTAAPGAAVAVSYQRGGTESFIAPVGNGGGDATARTAQTSTIASHISVTSGDLVDFFRGQCDDSGALTVPTITQTGVTYGAVTEYPATALLDGTSNDIAADGGYRIATAGTSSAAAVVTGTSAASEQHGAWMTRLRVVTTLAAFTPALIDQTAATFTPTITQGSPPPSPYRDAVVADSPVAYWRLGEPSGTNANDEIGSNDGTYTNTPTLGVVGPLRGETNTAVTFAGGSTEYVQVNDAATWDFGTSDYSIEFWFKTTSRSTMFIVEHGAENGVGFEAYWDGDHLSGRVQGAGANVHSGGAAGVFADGYWHHAILSMDRSGNGQWYVDGVASGSPVDISASVADSLAGSDPLFIGKRLTGLPFTGSLDEIALYTVALSEAQALAHFEAGVGGPYAAIVRADRPIAYWRLGEAAGTVAEDELLLNPGAYVNSPNLGVTGLLTGDADTAVNFVDGSTHHVRVPDHASLDLGDGPFSIEMWFSLDNPASAANRYMIAKGSVAPTIIAIGSGGATKIQADTYANQNCIRSSISISDTDEHHLVVTKAAGDTGSGIWKMYIDGVDVTTDLNTTSLGSVSTATDLFIGSTHVPDDGFEGELDEVAIYNYVLTLTQVGDHYAAGTGAAGSQAITLGLINQAAATFSPTVTRGAVAVVVALIDRTAVPHAPTVTATRNLTIGLINQTASPFTPTVTATRNLTIALLSQTAATFAPTVSATRNLTIALLSQAATPHAPTISVGAAPITLGLLSQPAATFTPTVTTTAAVSVALISQPAATFTPAFGIGFRPALINQAAATFTPTVTATAAISVGLINRTAATFTPTVVPGGVTVTLGLITQTAVPFTPTVSAVRNLTIALLSQTAAPFTPSVAPGAAPISVGLITQAAAPFTPTITTGAVTVALPLLSQPAVTFAPTVTSSATIALALVSQTAATFSPSVGTGIAIALLNRTAVASAPTITTGVVTVSLALISQPAATFAPTVTPGAANVSLALINQAATAHAPVVSAAFAISIGLINQTAQTFSPTVTAVTSVSLALIAQAASPFAPSVGAGIALGLINREAIAHDPSASTQATIAPALLTQTADTFDPSVTVGATSVSVGLTDQTAVAFGPTITTGVAPVTLGLINQTAQTLSPTISALSTISLALINQSAAAMDPAITAVAAVSLGLVSQPATTFAPAVTTGAADISVGLVTQAAIPFTPSLASVATVSLGLVNQTAATLAPVIVVAQFIDLDFLDRSAEAFDPDVTGQGGIALDLLEQPAATFDPTILAGAVTIDFGLISQPAAAFSPSITVGSTIALDLLDRTAAAFAPDTTSQAYIQFGLLGSLALAFTPTASGAQDVLLGRPDHTAIAFAPVTGSGTGSFPDNAIATLTMVDKPVGSVTMAGKPVGSLTVRTHVGTLTVQTAPIGEVVARRKQEASVE